MLGNKKEKIKAFHAFVCDEGSLEALKGINLESYNLTMRAQVGDIRDAIDYLKQNRSPNILLVDVSKSQLPITDISMLGDVSEPGMKVIAIGDRNDVSIFRDLVEIGVEDYIVKPLSVSLVLRAIENLIADDSEKAIVKTLGGAGRGKIVSFIPACGGVGCTTLAANTAYVMSEMKKKQVALIDLDLYSGSIAQFLNFPASSKFRDLMEEPERIDSVLVERACISYSDNLHLFCSESPFSENLQLSQLAYDNLASSLSRRYQYSIFDVPKNQAFSGMSLILDYSDTIVIVAEPTILSARAVVRMLQAIGGLAPSSSSRRIIVALNKVGKYPIGEIDNDTFRDAIGRTIDAVINFDGDTALDAIVKGVPAVCLDGAIAKGSKQLIDNILGYNAINDTTTQKSFLGKIFSK